MPDTNQRSNLKKDKWIAGGAAVLAVFILVFTDFGKNEQVVYDCRDAHWHPDVPVRVKEECAKMFKDNWERLQQLEKSKKVITT